MNRFQIPEVGVNELDFEPPNETVNFLSIRYQWTISAVDHGIQFFDPCKRNEPQIPYAERWQRIQCILLNW